ncbi:EGF-like domain protein [Oesophagostomum dentatum]|uniref:EGF-like domain protein n=1 Tax=Oesophagostomum dentatum TaxID=61180 RepID=A0A0B1TJI0_OESDE|nr:EGF-like domain protein [Oesophagostomum dentatum]
MSLISRSTSLVILGKVYPKISKRTQHSELSLNIVALHMENLGKYDADACNNHALCNADLGRGICIDTATSIGGHTCKCDPAYSGSECDTPTPGPCDSTPCLNGNCTGDNVLGTYICTCVEGYCGDNCDCMLNAEKILPEIHTCEYANNCVNGTCESIINGMVPGTYCICNPGFNGTFCDNEINECDSSPCMYGTCEDLFLDYNCTCDYGAEGKNCSIDIPDCVNYTVNGVVYENRCKAKDAGEYCDLSMFPLSVKLTQILYGYVPCCQLDMLLKMLEDLLRNPSQIKDMVPFIVGLQEDDNRTSLSWEYQDMFHWAAFEEKPLVPDRDLRSWNDVVLGNCFTFNHHSSEIDYSMRSSGIQGGLQTLMKVGADEYVPWYDTASVLVFVHSRDEYVFSESVRYNAQPSGETMILIRNAKANALSEAPIATEADDLW